jgi:cupin 2 domain-containing protein
MANVFQYPHPQVDKELFFSEFENECVSIKTIISNTLSTPQEFFQECDEWLIVLQGCAKIEMNGITHKLRKGDTLFIPARTKHTLRKTKKIVVWLAVYIDKEKK